MNVTQMARNQQMLYKFINRSTGGTFPYQSQTQSQLSSLNGLNVSAQSDAQGAAGLLQSMGFSGLQGRTVREMAQYQVRVQETQKTSSAQRSDNTAGLSAASSAQRFSVRQQYAPISDKATEAMQRRALEDAKNSIGSSGADGAARANLIREQLKDVEPSQRTAVFNTMNKVWESETERLGNYIKENDSSWQEWGDEFDTSILDDYKPGVNVWI